MEHFGLASMVYRASASDLEKVSSLNSTTIKNIIKHQRDESIYKYKDELEKLSIDFIDINNPKYPKLLKEIYDPPLGIYVLGNLPDDKIMKLGIVGSRRCSEYGAICSRKISRELSERGIVITSGLTVGIDYEAHLGAIEGGTPTIAVLPCGVNKCYPPENWKLKEKILENGAVISEFPPNANSMAKSFSLRNRIIAGLSKGIIFVEGSEKSGALSTVASALENGRDVFSVPGNITSRLSLGANRLIKDGAICLLSSEDVFNEYGIDIIKNKTKEETSNLSKEEESVYNLLSYEPITIEEIVVSVKSQMTTVNYILTCLEIKGKIKKLPGQRYVRAL